MASPAWLSGLLSGGCGPGCALAEVIQRKYLLLPSLSTLPRLLDIRSLLLLLALLNLDKLITVLPSMRFTGPVVIAMLLAVPTANSSPSVSEAEEDISIANMMESMVGLARVTK